MLVFHIWKTQRFLYKEIIPLSGDSTMLVELNFIALFLTSEDLPLDGT